MYNIIKNIIFQFHKWGLGIGDWGLGIGDWGLGQSPIPNPNPQSPIPIFEYIKLYNLKNYIYLIIVNFKFSIYK